MEVGLFLLLGGVAAGAFGSLLGLGGGLLIVPLLTIGFGMPVREAVGISLVCVIVTSSASASHFLERRQANLRLGMTLELFTATGAVIGGAIAFLMDERLLAGLFAAVLLYVAATMIRSSRSRSPRAALAEGVEPETDPAPVPEADDDAWLLEPTRLGLVESVAGRVPAAAAASVGAGVISALLGVGGGIVKVPLMHLYLHVPLRVATATSNLMVGITASTSAVVYLLRGGIDAYATGPTAIGVFVGATIGSRLASRIDVRILRLLFVVVLLYTAFEMGRRALAL
jgi:uncharacterized membrane protein YfcA